jgi:hypothetical protein
MKDSGNHLNDNMISLQTRHAESIAPHPRTQGNDLLLRRRKFQTVGEIGAADFPDEVRAAASDYFGILETSFGPPQTHQSYWRPAHAAPAP